MLQEQETDFREILSLFGVAFSSVRKDIPLVGSPERCGWRQVLEAEDGCLWVLEQLKEGQDAWRERVAQVLAVLAENQCPAVVPYEKVGEKFVLHHSSSSWQLQPYVSGEALPRPEYIEDAARGEAVAEFLAGFRTHAAGLAAPDQSEPFSLNAYVQELSETLARGRQDVYAPLVPVLRQLLEWEELFDSAPKALCHGDFHPLNVIWCKGRVEAVVDWEFMGLKPELYDLANCLGCVGSEDPRALVRGLCRACVLSLRDKGVITKQNEHTLVPLLLGLRMAWLSEWLRRHDTEMLEMEVQYMNIILQNRAALERIWGINA